MFLKSSEDFKADGTLALKSSSRRMILKKVLGEGIGKVSTLDVDSMVIKSSVPIVTTLSILHCGPTICSTQVRKVSKKVSMTMCQILCSMLLQCVSKILTSRRMLKKSSIDS